jgi:hypothetical protein
MATQPDPDPAPAPHAASVDPVTVEERFTTIAVHPGSTAELDRQGNAVLTRS